MSEPQAELGQDFVDNLNRWITSIHEETSFKRDKSRLELISKMNGGVLPIEIGGRTYTLLSR